MRALVLEDFHRMAVEVRPDPIPGPGEVLLEMVATGICGSDLHGYTGENGRRVPGQVMGHESAGRIVALGDGVTRDDLVIGSPATFNPVIVPESEVSEYIGREQHAPGKRVVGVASDIVSSFAQLVAVPARNVVPLPTDMPIENGALVEPFAVAIHAIRRLGLRADDRLVVAGGGPIGQSTVLAAIAAGVTQIVVSEPDTARRELVASLGAIVVDPSNGPLADQVHAVWGRPADAGADAVGITQTLGEVLSATRLGASVVLVGMGAPRLDLDAYAVSTQERTVIGSFTYSAPDFRDAADWIGAHPELAGRLISRQVPLDEAAHAFADLAAHDGTPGKVIVRLDR